MMGYSHEQRRKTFEPTDAISLSWRGHHSVVHVVLAASEITDQRRKSGQESYAAAYVYFPADFKTWWQEGDYSWQCRVESNCVASGAFEYHCRSNACVMIIKQ